MSNDMSLDTKLIERAQILAERQRQGLGVLTEEPGISLAACQSYTVDTGLLAGAYTDSLSVISKANGVGLGVLL